MKVIKTKWEARDFLVEIGLGARAVNNLMANTHETEYCRKFDWLRLPITETQICKNLIGGCENKQVFKCRNMGRKTAKEIGDCATKYLSEHPGGEEIPADIEMEDPDALTKGELELVIEVINRYKDFIDNISLMPGCSNVNDMEFDKVWGRLQAINRKLIGMAVCRRKEDE